MNLVKTTLITLLVTASALAALLIPLNRGPVVEQPNQATAATISLVDSPPPLLDSLPPPVQEEAIETPNDEPVKDLVPETIDSPLPSFPEEEEPTLKPAEPEEETRLEPDDQMVSDSSFSDPSLAASALSAEPTLSLVDGYYEEASTDQGPTFDRTTLASRIKYPPLAKRQGREGLVILRLFISASGMVERIEVEEDPGYGLSDAAVHAFVGLQGKPAILGGKAVPVTLRYPVRFTLK
ncbi:TonB family protein [Sphaerochaeta sp. PS]|uniref:energy transducer TonB n=1 Tax=Sphaerochaeta sp. PS TaxID=3076336 RepID=UPI0028A326AB|nr:TonB family protein [Sphaerochaeta sp. PS]MDT4762589.1 TonB family protein [Sphaerochaeta sp. PS]